MDTSSDEEFQKQGANSLGVKQGLSLIKRNGPLFKKANSSNGSIDFDNGSVLSSDSLGTTEFKPLSSGLTAQSQTDPNSSDFSSDPMLRKYLKCEKAKPWKVNQYKHCFPTSMTNFMPQKYVNIEGPEYDLDFSYFVIHM